MYENVTTQVDVVEEAPPEEWLAARAKARARAEALANTPDAKVDEALIKYDKGLTLHNDKRTPQHAQTLMGFSILLGTLIFSIADAVSRRRKLNLEQLQLKEMELEMEAEKNAVVPENGATAFGSLEHGGDERGQEMFNAFKWQQDHLSERQVRDASINSHLPLGPAGAISELNVTMGSGQGGTVHGTIEAKRNSDSGRNVFDPLGTRHDGALVTPHRDAREDPFAGRDSWPGETFDMTQRTQNSIRVPRRGIIQDNEPRIRGLSQSEASARNSPDHALGSIRTQNERQSLNADLQEEQAPGADFPQAFKYIPQHVAKPPGELPPIDQKGANATDEKTEEAQ